MIDKRIDQLRQLAALRTQRAAARLARKQALVETLAARATALRTEDSSELTDITLLAARERHARWRHEQLIRLATDIAMAQAEAQPYREAHARDSAREKVLERLATGRKR